jgi:hypothetical protein
MPMNDAFLFIRRCREDAAFREEAYFCKSPKILFSWIKTSGYTFTMNEIDDAFRALQLQAADESEASEILELGQWFHIMVQRPSSSACASCHQDP